MQIGKYPANVLLHQPESAADVEARANEESVHEAEGENGAGTGSGQEHVGERKDSWLHGKRGQSVQKELRLMANGEWRMAYLKCFWRGQLESLLMYHLPSTKLVEELFILTDTRCLRK